LLVRLLTAPAFALFFFSLARFPATPSSFPPTQRGYFAGQQGYGYRSMEAFVDAASEVMSGAASAAEIEKAGVLATADSTLPVTAILEAGRRSLDAGGKPVRIIYGADGRASAFEV
jgi:D-galacturonate reductase